MRQVKFFIYIAVVLSLSLMLFCGQNNPDDQISIESSQQAEEKTGSDDRLVPVEVLVLKYQDAKENIPLTGVLRPLFSVDIVAEISGKITKISKKLGDPVTTRDTLAFIDDKIPMSNYLQAKSQVLSAQTRLKISQLNLKSDKDLYKNGDISELAYENSLLDVKTSEADLQSTIANLNLREKNYLDSRITSPISGLVARKYVELGTMVIQNMTLYRIVDLSTLKIEVGIPQSRISRVKLGSKTKVTISALGDRKIDGTVRFISPQADENSGTFTTEIYVKNTANQEIRAGMTAKIDLSLNVGATFGRLIIPDYAIVTKNQDSFVYKIQSGVARLTEISISATFGSRIFVDQGLVQGDTVVIVGKKNLGVDTKVWIEEVH